MSDRWFSEEQLERMSTPVIERTTKAIRGGLTGEAIRLCDELKEERIVLHDFQAEACTALATWIGGELGEERLEDAFTHIFEHSAVRQVYALLGTGVDRALEASLLARNCWLAHACSGAGEHPSAFRVVEDDEKFTFIMDPCGSGGRLWRKGMYGPPVEFGMTSRPYPWSYGRADFPYYCTHCAFLNELLPYKYLGFSTWPVDPPKDAMDTCRWHLYKDRRAVPREYYERMGLSKKEDTRGPTSIRRRCFDEGRLAEMARPTPERIRHALEKKDRHTALRVCRDMRGEFFFLHSLYVNALVSGIDFIARGAGEERLGDVFSFVYEKCVQEQAARQLRDLPPRDALAYLVTNFFLAGTCGGAGYPRAKVKVAENHSEVTIVLDPCASGGALLRGRAYEPGGRPTRARERLEDGLLSAAAKLPIPLRAMERVIPAITDYISSTRKPRGMGTTREGLPYYCAMCTSLLGRSGGDWLEVNPPFGRKAPCVWRARK